MQQLHLFFIDFDEIYAPIPESSQRYRFVALNEMGRVLVEGGLRGDEGG